MKTNALIPAGVAVMFFACFNVGRSTVIFSQDFSSAPDGPVSAYVSSSSPNCGQWNAIGTSGASTTVSIANGELSFTRAGGNSGSFSRTTDFSPAPEAMIYKFTLAVSGNTAAQTTAATWQVGAGFGTANSAEAVGLVHSRFVINFGSAAGTFQFRDTGAGQDSTTFSGAQAVMWVINNSGSTLSYLAPNNTVQTVANDAWDLWAGNSLALNERPADNGALSLTDLKFAFSQGSGTITMDDFQIEAVPEPQQFALISGLALLGVVVGTFCKRRLATLAIH
jgi:hypothetical protein